MSNTRPKEFRLDVTVECDGFLLAEGRLGKVQELLCEVAPRWSTGLHVWLEDAPKKRIDVSVPGALGSAVESAATERGPFFAELEQRFGAVTSSRIWGGAELHGSDKSLILVVEVDEEVFQRIGEAWLWANHLTLQVCRPRVDDVDAINWSANTFEMLCQLLSPAWGHAQITAEYDAKNISREGGGMRAVGVDISRALPGIYWLNFYGRTCRDRIGRERLLTAPAAQVREVDDGVLLMLHPDPAAWDTPEYKATEGRVLEHLGPHYFFSKEAPDRQTVPPVEGLPLLPPVQPVGEPEKLQEGVWWRFWR
jgi:hypothetical protein